MLLWYSVGMGRIGQVFNYNIASISRYIVETFWINLRVLTECVSLGLLKVQPEALSKLGLH
jgi:hypothetical protein